MRDGNLTWNTRVRHALGIWESATKMGTSPRKTWRYHGIFMDMIYDIYDIYDIWLLIKILLSRNGHSSRITILLSRNFRELHAYLSRGPCWPTTPLNSFATCQITPENHGSLLGSLLNMQLASRNPFSGQLFLQSLLAHPLQHAL